MYRLTRAMAAPARRRSREPGPSGPIAAPGPIDRVATMAVGTGGIVTTGSGFVGPADGATRNGDERQRAFRAAVAIGVVMLAAFTIWPVLFGNGSRAATSVTALTETVVAAIAVAATAWRAARLRAFGWWLISASVAAWLVGQLVWTWHEVVRQLPPDTTSAADVGFLAALPLAFAGY